MINEKSDEWMEKLEKSFLLALLSFPSTQFKPKILLQQCSYRRHAVSYVVVVVMGWGRGGVGGKVKLRGRSGAAALTEPLCGGAALMV